ncbi:hypothetical protein DNTS_004987 [Danionella cerebrum]|uniref:Uncharacterized protein n=1 Tax=Danionella cerebrum TaxID=2873325 RepID=A0A553RLC9_9TELE|nr:hypothetical protein DNTS_004987 [Danionella translucida]
METQDWLELDESEEGQGERVHDADDGQDVRPAHRAVAQRVFVRALTAHPLDLLRVPSVGKKNKLKQTMVPTIRSREMPTKNMAVLKAPEGMEPKSRALPLHTSSPVMGFPMQRRCGAEEFSQALRDEGQTHNTASSWGWRESMKCSSAQFTVRLERWSGGAICCPSEQFREHPSITLVCITVTAEESIEDSTPGNKTLDNKRWLTLSSCDVMLLQDTCCHRHSTICEADRVRLRMHETDKRTPTTTTPHRDLSVVHRLFNSISTWLTEADPCDQRPQGQINVRRKRFGTSGGRINGVSLTWASVPGFFPTQMVMVLGEDGCRHEHAPGRLTQMKSADSVPGRSHSMARSASDMNGGSSASPTLAGTLGSCPLYRSFCLARGNSSRKHGDPKRLLCEGLFEVSPPDCQNPPGLAENVSVLLGGIMLIFEAPGNQAREKTCDLKHSPKPIRSRASLDSNPHPDLATQIY